MAGTERRVMRCTPALQLANAWGFPQASCADGRPVGYSAASIRHKGGTCICMKEIVCMVAVGLGRNWGFPHVSVAAVLLWMVTKAFRGSRVGRNIMLVKDHLGHIKDVRQDHMT